MNSVQDIHASVDASSERGPRLPSVRCSSAEWGARVELAACYRLIAMFGWDDLIYSRVSARVPDEPDRFLLNPFGLFFEEVTASSLIKVDREGRAVEPTSEEVNPEGFVPLIALHDARPDIHCVVHTHSLHGTAVATQSEGLLPATQQALLQVSYHPYEGYPLRDAEKLRMQRHLGDSNAMIMNNHGLVTVGGSVPEAFLVMHRLETACQIQLLAQSGGAGLIPISESTLAYIRQAAGPSTASRVGPALAWRGLLRRLDRTFPGYAA